MAVHIGRAVLNTPSQDSPRRSIIRASACTGTEMNRKDSTESNDRLRAFRAPFIIDTPSCLRRMFVGGHGHRHRHVGQIRSSIRRQSGGRPCRGSQPRQPCRRSHRIRRLRGANASRGPRGRDRPLPRRPLECGSTIRIHSVSLPWLHGRWPEWPPDTGPAASRGIPRLQAAAARLERGETFDPGPRESGSPPICQVFVKSDADHAQDRHTERVRETTTNANDDRDLEIWLGGRDSNPDTMVQSHVSYRWTTSQHGGERSV